MCDFPLPGGSEISQDLTCLCCRLLGGCSREGRRAAQRLLYHWVACFCCFTNAALLARGQGQSNEKIMRRGRQCLICFSGHSWPNSRWPAADKNGSQRRFFGHCSWPSPQPDCPLAKRIFWVCLPTRSKSKDSDGTIMQWRAASQKIRRPTPGLITGW